MHVVADPARLIHLQLTAASRVIVASVDLNQTGCRSHAVHVVVAFKNAREDLQRSVFSEVVYASRLETVRLARSHIHGAVHRCLRICADIVVSAIVLNQTDICRTHAVLVVVQNSILIDNISRHDDAAHVVKAIHARGERITVHLRHPTRLTDNDLAARADAVIVLAHLHKASILYPSALIVVVVHTVFIHNLFGHDDLSVSSKTIHASSERIIVHL